MRTARRLPGHVMPTARRLPGHVMRTVRRLPGHVMPTARRLPGHVMRTVRRLPGHVMRTARCHREHASTVRPQRGHVTCTVRLDRRPISRRSRRTVARISHVESAAGEFLRRVRVHYMSRTPVLYQEIAVDMCIYLQSVAIEISLKV